tara:strand:- start:2520 stop:2831 length:312 start_codon:yes stop_codon:yes gene_type:complete
MSTAARVTYRPTTAHTSPTSPGIEAVAADAPGSGYGGLLFFSGAYYKTMQADAPPVHSCAGSFVGGFFVGILVLLISAHLVFKYTRLLDDTLDLAQKHRNPMM